jgi:dephospho-CoA kinase
MFIGLTGKYCAGKNHVAALLEKRGLTVIDVDKLGYQVLETEKEAIFAQFGNDLKKTDGSLDRRLLGQKVFGNPEKLAALEAIIHPPVNRLIDEWIENMDKASSVPKIYVINAALLHKAAIFSRLDCIILVTAPFFTRIWRAKKRDHLSFRQILKRFGSQRDFNSQYLAGNAEIKRVGNSSVSGAEKMHKKLESRIDRILEGII